MKHQSHKKRVRPLEKRLRRMAAAFAGAALLSTAAMTGAPAIAHAAVPESPAPSPPAQQQQQEQQQAAPDKAEKTVDVVATAYAAGPHDNDQYGSKTYLGTTVRPGIIAVDPKVIPLGSKVYIEYPDGHGAYAVAEDTGGAIKGNRVDIAMGSVGDAYDFGIKNCKIHVISSPSTPLKAGQHENNPG